MGDRCFCKLTFHKEDWDKWEEEIKTWADDNGFRLGEYDNEVGVLCDDQCNYGATSARQNLALGGELGEGTRCPRFFGYHSAGSEYDGCTFYSDGDGDHFEWVESNEGEPSLQLVWNDGIPSFREGQIEGCLHFYKEWFAMKQEILKSWEEVE